MAEQKPIGAALSVLGGGRAGSPFALGKGKNKWLTASSLVGGEAPAAAADSPPDPWRGFTRQLDDSRGRLHTLLKVSLDEAVRGAMAVVDEEDAAFLVRVTRLAESSPLLQEATDRRRAAVERALSEQLSGAWTSLRHALNETCEELSVGDVTTHRVVLGERLHAQESLLGQARRAHAVQEHHWQVEKEAAIKEALRLQKIELMSRSEFKAQQLQEQLAQRTRELDMRLEAQRKQAEAQLNELADKLRRTDEKWREARAQADEGKKALALLEKRLADTAAREAAAQRAAGETAASMKGLLKTTEEQMERLRGQLSTAQNLQRSAEQEAVEARKAARAEVDAANARAQQAQDRQEATLAELRTAEQLHEEALVRLNEALGKSGQEVARAREEKARVEAEAAVAIDEEREAAARLEAARLAAGLEKERKLAEQMKQMIDGKMQQVSTLKSKNIVGGWRGGMKQAQLDRKDEELEEARAEAAAAKAAQVTVVRPQPMGLPVGGMAMQLLRTKATFKAVLAAQMSVLVPELQAEEWRGDMEAARRRAAEERRGCEVGEVVRGEIDALERMSKAP